MLSFLCLLEGWHEAAPLFCAAEMLLCHLIFYSGHLVHVLCGGSLSSILLHHVLARENTVNWGNHFVHCSCSIPELPSVIFPLLVSGMIGKCHPILVQDAGS